MTKREDYIKSLKEYYQKQQIGVANFNCKHMGDSDRKCSPGAKSNRNSEVNVDKNMVIYSNY